MVNFHSQNHLNLIVILTTLLVLMSSCSTRNNNKEIILIQTKFSDLNQWKEGNFENSLESFRNSCKRIAININPANKGESKAQIDFDYSKLQTICTNLVRNKPSNVKLFFERNFTPYKVSYNGSDLGSFTGYYEPYIKASRTKSSKYKYPIYSKPSNLDKKEPFFTRKQINEGVLNNKNLEILWAEDQVELFFLHIQGSGQILLDNGETTRVGFAAKNNHQYYAIGKYLLDKGYIFKEKMSAQSITKWLKENPSQIAYVMNKNSSYIFFREIQNKDGPIGAFGVELTPESSIAIDNDYIPYGLPIWLSTNITATNQSFNNLLITQDTGSAIKGAVRGDIFFGSGAKAKNFAGKQKHMGKYYILLPK